MVLFYLPYSLHATGVLIELLYYPEAVQGLFFYMASTPVGFLKETRDELSKVVWPKRQEVIRLTGVVIGVSFLVGIFVGGLDFVFTKILGLLIK